MASVAQLPGLRMHYRDSGVGEPVVLLHGWPQDSRCWRLVEPELAASYRVICPDLRGYGLSDKPHDGYDKRTMAADVVALADHLGLDRLRLVGHDRGARVAHRLALDHPDRVSHLAVLDVVPTLEMFRNGTPETARGYWHWLFHLNPDLPELLVGDRIEEYLRWFFERWTFQRSPVEEAVPYYVALFSRPGALRASFDDYRGTYRGDLQLDQADRDAGRRVAVPVLALWGEHGLPASLPVREMWAEYAADVTGEAIPDCGHFLAEEQPRALLDRLLPFLGAGGH